MNKNAKKDNERWNCKKKELVHLCILINPSSDNSSAKVKTMWISSEVDIVEQLKAYIRVKKMVATDALFELFIWEKEGFVYNAEDYEELK